MAFLQRSAKSGLPIVLSFLVGGSANAQTHHHHHATTPNEANIVETARNSGDLELFVGALEKAQLEHTLQGPGPFTVFVPYDGAFQKIPTAGRTDLKDPAKLTKILQFHVVQGKLNGSQLAATKSLKTIEGDCLMVNSKDNLVIVDGAEVTKPDIECSNGVIHIIDAVLMPK